MQEINSDIIIEQIESIIERAISENEKVLQSLGMNEGEEERINETGGMQHETSSREELQIIR